MKDLGKGVSIRITSPEVAVYIRKLFGRLLFDHFFLLLCDRWPIYMYVTASSKNLWLEFGTSIFLSKFYNCKFSAKKGRKDNYCFPAAYVKISVIYEPEWRKLSRIAKRKLIHILAGQLKLNSTVIFWKNQEVDFVQRQVIRSVAMSLKKSGAFVQISQ